MTIEVLISTRRRNHAIKSFAFDLNLNFYCGPVGRAYTKSIKEMSFCPFALLHNTFSFDSASERCDAVEKRKFRVVTV